MASRAASAWSSSSTRPWLTRYTRWHSPSTLGRWVVTMQV